MAPPSRTEGGGGGGAHTRLRVRGWGRPNSGDWRKSLALCILCGLHDSLNRQCIHLDWDVLWQLICRIKAQSTYECRVQSSVWRLPKYWPPTPSPPSECVLPPHQSRAVRWWGSIFWKTPDIGLASCIIIPLRKKSITVLRKQNVLQKI